MFIKIGVSARHMHISREDLEYFFGLGFELTPEKELSQVGEYASTSKLKIKGPKGELSVRILGPVRDYTQIEISKTDAFSVGLNPPVRNSGDLLGSSSVTLTDGNKELLKSEGCIIATRHIHMSNKELEQFGMIEGNLYKVKVGGEKGCIMENVHVKAEDDFSLELHIDTDDANANLIKNGDIGEVIR
jgi:putative phosphotransacetylase